MSRYNSEFPFPIAFPPSSMDNVLAEWLAKKGAKQCHIAGASLEGYNASTSMLAYPLLTDDISLRSFQRLRSQF